MANSESSRLNVSESEEELISTAQHAVSQSNWVVGECAAKWTVKFARGRTDADFAVLVGLTPDQVYQRRRVWETFGDVRGEYPSLKWSHYYVSLNWDDAPECLQWANENEATVKEMRTWRKATRGEELDTLTTELDEWGDPGVSYVPTESVAVKNPGNFPSGGPGSPGGTSTATAGTMAIAARETAGGEAEYAPFRSDAASPGPKHSEDGPEQKGQPSDEQILKRMVVTLERINQEFTPERARLLSGLSDKVRNRFVKAIGELSSKVAESM